jgi:hypothetical protein
MMASQRLNQRTSETRLHWSLRHMKKFIMVLTVADEADISEVLLTVFAHSRIGARMLATRYNARWNRRILEIDFQ